MRFKTHFIKVIWLYLIDIKFTLTICLEYIYNQHSVKNHITNSCKIQER